MAKQKSAFFRCFSLAMGVSLYPTIPNLVP